MPNEIHINKDNNSEIIGNYFEGFYFDKIYGKFELQGVAIIESTDKCNDSYGYKLGGKAISQTVGIIDFNYDANTFVYYCMGDKKLHGYAMSLISGKQNFDGVSFEVVPNVNEIETPNKSGLFVNDTTVIGQEFYYGNIMLVGGNVKSTSYGEENIFYIFKPKK